MTQVFSPKHLHRFDSVWLSTTFSNSLKQALIIKRKHLWHKRLLHDKQAAFILSPWVKIKDVVKTNEEGMIYY